MKFIVREQADYEVEAARAQEALDQFLNGDSIGNFNCTVNDRAVLNEAGEEQDVRDI